MNSLIQTIEQAIKVAFEEYTDRIVKEYNEVDRKELQILWQNVVSDFKISIKPPPPAGCPYEYVRTPKAGTRCNAKPKNENVYCARHKKYENKPLKTRKVVPSPKKSIKPKTKKTSPVPKKTQRVLRTNRELGVLWHPDTGFVFNSAKDRTVTQRVVDGKVRDLADEDIDDCKKWGFAFELPYEGVSSDEEETALTEHRVYLVADSKSGQKFWEVVVNDTSYTVRYGKVGKNGASKTKEFASNAAAMKELAKQQGKKEQKGYEVQTHNAHNDSSSEEEEPPPKSKKRRAPEVEESSDDDIQDVLEEVQENAEKYISKALGVDAEIEEDFSSFGEDEDLLESSEDE